MIEKVMRLKLEESLSPLVLEITDQSHLHKGHQGFSGESGTHFKIVLVSEQFSGKSLLNRHRLVHTLLAEEIKHIHALQLSLKSPKEQDAI